MRVLAAFNLTGRDSELDTSAYNGARVAMKEINDAGGVLGRDVELIPVDTNSNTVNAIKAVKEVFKTESDIVAGIGYCDSTFASVIGALFQEKGLPFVSPGATDPKLPGRVGNDLFLAAYGDDAQARTMAQYASSRLGAQTIAVWIDDSQEYTTAVGTYFAESFQSLGGHIATHTVQTAKNDFSAFIKSVKSAKPSPDAIYGATMPAQAVAFVSQLRAAGIDSPLLSGDGWDEEPLVTLSKDKKLRDIYFTTHRFLGIETGAMKAFVAAYEAETGHPPTNAFAALGYDALGLLANAINRAASTKPKAIRKALADTTDYEGVVGPISYRNGSRVPIKPVSVIELSEGQETAVWSVTP